MSDHSVTHATFTLERQRIVSRGDRLVLVEAGGYLDALGRHLGEGNDA